MNPAPWDDPLAVALVAAQLLGKTTNEERIALSLARSLLRSAAHVIAEENEDAAIRAELDADPMSERRFIDSMVEGHCHDQRFDRRKAFFERTWTRLRQEYTQYNPPGLDDPSQLYTLATLQGYIDLFGKVCSCEAAKARTRKKI
jgi:hypothetical protein